MWYQAVLICALSIFSAACSNSKFEGGAERRTSHNSGEGEKGLIVGEPAVSPATNTPVVGENTPVDCSTSSVVDESAILDTQALEPDLNSFVSRKCSTQISNNYADAGGLNAEEETRTAICNMMGYAKASPTEFVTWKFSSPYNNYVIYWEPSTKEMIKKYDARTSVKGQPGNNMVKSTKCVGKLKVECPVKDLEVLKCK